MQEQLSPEQSLKVITQMIQKARNAYYDTGVSAIMWGAIITFCSLEKLAEIQFGYRLPFDIYLLTIVAIVPQVMISIREKKQRRVTSFDDVYMDYIWLAFGISIALMITLVNVMLRNWGPVFEEYNRLAGQPSGFRFYEYITPMFLILYGIPTFITGTACKFQPMLWGGILCWVCCVLTMFTLIRVDLLLTAVSAIGAWLIPGLILKREYNRARKQLEGMNV
ncbi:MAG TPA: hypothetical protein VEB63_11135 [Chitinophagaceae bacterium]|nr:hypothetical protein [Chitinophagaceae bacterium]